MSFYLKTDKICELVQGPVKTSKNLKNHQAFVVKLMFVYKPSYRQLWKVCHTELDFLLLLKDKCSAATWAMRLLKKVKVKERHKKVKVCHTELDFLLLLLLLDKCSAASWAIYFSEKWMWVWCTEKWKCVTQKGMPTAGWQRLFWKVKTGKWCIKVKEGHTDLQSK